MSLVEEVGQLSRVPRGPKGIEVFPPGRAEWSDAVDSDFGLQLAGWLALEHIRRHVRKTTGAPAPSRHLFLVPLDEVLPIRFFTDLFEAPGYLPDGYRGLDGLWVWSAHWQRVLVWQGGEWAWHEIPTAAGVVG